MSARWWLGLAISTLVGAQAFETASIKLSKPGDLQRPSMEFLPGGRFRSIHIPLLPVLATAYNLPFATREYLRIKNVPDWIFSELYDIEATPAVPGQRIRPMLRALFAERFKLKIRTDIVETAVYAIAIGPHGPKLEPSKIDERDCVESDQLNTGSGCHQILGGMGRGMHGSAVTVADIALYASGWSDAPLVDQTGLTGLYAILTEGWSTGLDDDPSRPTLSEIFERMGLKLVRKRARVEIFTIEHVERPSKN
jgi:uncharacterized protein (TIGR03435 family)